MSSNHYRLPKIGSNAERSWLDRIWVTVGFFEDFAFDDVEMTGAKRVLFIYTCFCPKCYHSYSMRRHTRVWERNICRRNENVRQTRLPLLGINCKESRNKLFIFPLSNSLSSFHSRPTPPTSLLKSARGSGDIGKWDGRMFKLELVFISCLISWRLSPRLSAANLSDLPEACRREQRTQSPHRHTHTHGGGGCTAKNTHWHRMTYTKSKSSTDMPSFKHAFWNLW